MIRMANQRAIFYFFNVFIFNVFISYVFIFFGETVCNWWNGVFDE
jgi:hypothetical protein